MYLPFHVEYDSYRIFLGVYQGNLHRRGKFWLCHLADEVVGRQSLKTVDCKFNVPADPLLNFTKGALFLCLRSRNLHSISPPFCDRRLVCVC